MNEEYIKVLDAIKNKFPDLFKEAKTDKDLKILASFYNIGSVYPKLNSEILKLAILISKKYEPKNLNDFYSIILTSIQNINGFKKQAYPQNPLIASDDFSNEEDLVKWSKLVYKIYDAVLTQDMSLQNAIDYYSNTLNKKSQEDFRFKQWIKYYLNGEDKKYADKELEIKKQSNYEVGLAPSNFYYPDTRPMKEKELEEIPVKKLLENNIDEVNKKENIKEWREKLDGAIRRIDKLIRNVTHLLGSEKALELAQSLHDFDMSVRKINHQTTAVDLTYGIANRFKKVGFPVGAQILTKTAQDLAEPTSEPTPKLTPELSSVPASEKNILAEKPVAENRPSVDPVSRIYETPSGAKEGEYESLDEEVDLSDALSKLEEIAARLADRRVIRLLAEFDIILDKIGIAAMFPELSESQSKLIDGYSYALVRVTKMLGMLSTGKNLSEISKAKKDELTSGVRKNVDRTFNPEEASKALRGEEAIKEEFEKKQTPPPEPIETPSPPTKLPEG